MAPFFVSSPPDRKRKCRNSSTALGLNGGRFFFWTSNQQVSPYFAYPDCLLETQTFNRVELWGTFGRNVTTYQANNDAYDHACNDPEPGYKETGV